jgi:hypothetical protein
MKARMSALEGRESVFLDWVFKILVLRRAHNLKNRLAVFVRGHAPIMGRD